MRFFLSGIESKNMGLIMEINLYVIFLLQGKFLVENFFTFLQKLVTS